MIFGKQAFIEECIYYITELETYQGDDVYLRIQPAAPVHPLRISNFFNPHCAGSFTARRGRASMARSRKGPILMLRAGRMAVLCRRLRLMATNRLYRCSSRLARSISARRIQIAGRHFHELQSMGTRDY